VSSNVGHPDREESLLYVLPDESLSLSFPVETTAYSFIDALHLIFMDLPCTKHCSKKYGSNTDNEFTHVFQILC